MEKKKWMLIHEEWTVTRMVKEGDLLKSFRGEAHVFKGVEQYPSEGKGGKLITDRGVFYPSVFDCRFVEMK